MKAPILIFCLLLSSVNAGPIMLGACCTGACAVETPPIDGGVATGVFIATCTAACISTAGSVVGIAGPVCVWASFIGW